MPYAIQIVFPLQNKQLVKQWRRGVGFRASGLSQRGMPSSVGECKIIILSPWTVHWGKRCLKTNSEMY